MVKNSVFLVFCIFVLFEVKYSSISIEERIEKNISLEAKLEEEYRILQADWKFLTSPDRIQRLSNIYLGLRETELFQIKTIDAYREKTIYTVNKKKIKSF